MELTLSLCLFWKVQSYEKFAQVLKYVLHFLRFPRWKALSGLRTWTYCELFLNFAVVFKQVRPHRRGLTLLSSLLQKAILSHHESEAGLRFDPYFQQGAQVSFLGSLCPDLSFRTSFVTFLEDEDASRTSVR